MKLELYFIPAIIIVSALIALAGLQHEGGHAQPVVEQHSYGLVLAAGD